MDLIRSYSVIYIIILVLFLGFAGCNPNLPPSTAQEKIDRARALIRKHPGFFKQAEPALNQPDFTGALREHGCMAFFDSSGRVTKAYTLKIKDYETGRTFQIRSYTLVELDEATPQIQAYRNNLGLNDADAVFVVSQSMMSAFADSVLNEKPTISFLFARGIGSSAKEMQLIRRQSGINEVVASEAIYATLEDMS